MSRLPAVADWPRAALMLAVRGYRLFFSAWLGSGCRFTPSCSAYALEALERHGALGGSYLTGRRLLRCHPGCDGGHDPVPEQRRGWLTRGGHRPPATFTSDRGAPSTSTRHPSEIST